ncbi:MAG: protein tyrosine phosphatase [Nocardioides sp.]|nr:protein tyrosine phosphatase [Nocardioides sp.]
MTAPGAGTGTWSFTVLVVCEGNICRSPVAEVLLRKALAGAPGVHVTSAGMRARAGSPVESTMAQLLGEDAPEDFAARQVTAAAVNHAGLVLAMTRDQRSALVQLAPGCLRRTFTLREFAELALLVRRDRPVAAASGAEVLAELALLGPRYRDRRDARRGGDDIDDPFGRSPEEHVRAFRAIDDAVAGIAVAVLGWAVPTARPTIGATSGTPA